MSSKSVAVDAWEALFRAQVAVLRHLQQEFPSDKLSLNEYDVLFNLARRPERRSRLRDLNRYLLLTQPSVSRLVDRLVSRRLLAKAPDPGDGRGTIVSLTDEGYALFRSIAAIHSESISLRVGAVLSVEELQTLTSLCEKLRDEP